MSPISVEHNQCACHDLFVKPVGKARQLPTANNRLLADAAARPERGGGPLACHPAAGRLASTPPMRCLLGRAACVQAHGLRCSIGRVGRLIAATQTARADHCAIALMTTRTMMPSRGRKLSTSFSSAGFSRGRLRSLARSTIPCVPTSLSCHRRWRRGSSPEPWPGPGPQPKPRAFGTSEREAQPYLQPFRI